MTNSEFNKKYQELIEIIQPDFKKLEEMIAAAFEKQKPRSSQVLPILKDFLSNKGKRLRPALIFLFARAMKKDTDDFYIKLALANEIIHNATLIHDDIIDCSLMRRGQKTINFDYDSKLAVLCGDFLIAQALKLLFDIEDTRIRKLHSDTVSKLIEGEIRQYFSRYKLLSIEDYTEKSKDKTARLFEAGLVSIGLYKNSEGKNIEQVRQFALNFGTAFQINNDLNNLCDPEKAGEDLNNGDYSAPFIYYVQEKYNGDISKVKNLKQLPKQIKNTDAVKKTEQLAQHYLNMAIENTSFLEDNQYKRTIIDLCNLFAGK